MLSPIRYLKNRQTFRKMDNILLLALISVNLYLIPMLQ